MSNRVQNERAGNPGMFLEPISLPVKAQQPMALTLDIQEAVNRVVWVFIDEMDR